mmetsp:Transcript_297/g.833  ORF Transcript_297/g.833 Transcript_297/m.833 type:complete len:292 (-) Transcript_297:1118-1993(-)
MELFHHEYTAERILNSCVRCRRSRCHPHHHLLFQVQDEGLSNNLPIYRPMSDCVVGADALGAVDVERPNILLVGNFQKVSRVGRVPSPNDQDEIKSEILLILHEVVDGILALLSGVTNRVELHVVVLGIDGAVLLHHGLLQELADGPRLLLVHGGLVRKSDLLEHGVGVKSLGDGILKVLEEGLLVPPLSHVVDDHLRLLHVLDDDVILAEGHGGNSLLVRVLPVNDRGQPLLLVLVDSVPHLRHPRAGSVDDIDVLVSGRKAKSEGFNMAQGRQKSDYCEIDSFMTPTLA